MTSIEDIAKDFNNDIQTEVLLYQLRVIEHLEKNFPVMPRDWYRDESLRRAEIYFKEKSKK